MKKDGILNILPLIIFVLVLVPVLAATIFVKRDLSEEDFEDNSSTIVDHYEDTIPVISETNYIGYPYLDPSVTVGKTFYDYKGEESSQEQSLILDDNTYYQNTGIDYAKEEIFDVIAIADGDVALVKEDDLVGKTIEIEHKNGLISIYQSLSDINVKKGDIVKQGQVIGKSGTNEMDKELGNHLHFEIYENGSSVNPELYINKEYKKEN